MNIIVDARMAFHTGIGRYIRSLCRALLTQPSEHTLSLLLDPLITPQVRQEIGPTQIIPFPAKIYSLREQVQSLWLYRTHAKQASLFHCPHYNVPWFLPRNSVVTVHDLTHFQFPERFGRHRAMLAFRLLRRAVQRAGHLIAVSQATQQDLTTLVPEAEGKTTVIHHGVSEHFSPLSAAEIETFKRTNNLGPFFLYLGSVRPHKNMLRVLQAFRHVKTRFAQMELVLIGVEPSDLSGPLEGVRTFPKVPEAELVHWYNAAEVFVFPSLNEGFGLPALEAMACGTPVLGSNIAALTEVTGNAGLLVNPWDAEALAQAMQQLVSSRDLRHRLRRQGLQRAKAFTWTRAAEKTLQVYRAVEHLA